MEMKADENLLKNSQGQEAISVRTAKLQANEFLARQQIPDLILHHAQGFHVRNPLQYINPTVFGGQRGQLPFVLSGTVQERPSWEEQYKTVMCEAWLTDGHCYYGAECRFAHGEHELRPTTYKPAPRNTRKLKTKLCEKYTRNGICPYGENCFFIHPDPSNPFNQEFFHLNQFVSQIQQEILSNEMRGVYSCSTNNRVGLSSSVPNPSRFPEQANLVRRTLYPLDEFPFMSSARNLGASSHLISIPEQGSFPSTSFKSTSTNDTSPPTNILREQLKEQLLKSEVKHLSPEAQTKSNDYNPLVGGVDFMSKFSQSLKSQNSFDCSKQERDQKLA